MYIHLHCAELKERDSLYIVVDDISYWYGKTDSFVVLRNGPIFKVVESPGEIYHKVAQIAKKI